MPLLIPDPRALIPESYAQPDVFPQLLQPIDFRGMFKMPALGYVQIAINHSIHHRGQLSMYLRPMGAKVPSIYGESYDAREARERAAQTG